MLPVIFLVNLRTQLEDDNAPDKHACKRMWNIYDDVICCKAPPPNLNSANIFLRSVWGQTAKLKDRQYFRLYDTIYDDWVSRYFVVGIGLGPGRSEFLLYEVRFSLTLARESEKEKGRICVASQQAKLLMCFILCWRANVAFLPSMFS